MKIQTSSYGQTRDGSAAELFTLTNDHGMTAMLTNFGAILVGLAAPDRTGKAADVTLGYDSLAGWVTNPSYLGSTVGRVGNRIAGARFTLDGKTYPLAANNGAHHIHGGIKGFHQQLWDARTAESNKEAGVVFRRVSPDGEEGYPGALTAQVTYTLTADNELNVDFEARTDAPTIVNLVHHTYWNLTGDPRRTILEHDLQIDSDRYVPVGPDLIPTGKIEPVAGTPLDFTKPTAIGKRIEQVPGGYDHCWVLRSTDGNLARACRLSDPRSGRVMEIFTDQPGIQFYSGNFLDGSIVGKGGVSYGRRCGLCLETQKWPDAVHHSNFPSIELRPGEIYRHRMIHKFGVKA